MNRPVGSDGIACDAVWRPYDRRIARESEYASLDEAIYGPRRTRDLKAVLKEISPDGTRAVALQVLSRTGYLLEAAYERTPSGWEVANTGSAGHSWTGPEDEQAPGVLTISGAAPRFVRAVVVRVRGAEHRVPVERGHFLFVDWATLWRDQAAAAVVAYEYTLGLRRRVT